MGSDIIERPRNAVTVVAAAHPLQLGAQVSYMPSGMTVAQIVDKVQLAPQLREYAVAFIEGERVPEDMWHLVRLKPGANIQIRVVPKGPLIPLLAIAAQAFAGALGSFLLGSTLASTVLFGTLTLGTLVGGIIISTVAMLVMNAIAAPQSSSASDAMKNSPSYTDNPVYSISGGGNALQKWGAVPTAFGTYRAFPPLGAQYYTEIVGNDQYLRLVVVWGYGPLQISDLRIGDTPIDQYDGVQIETQDGSAANQPLSLYPESVIQQDLQVALTQKLGGQVKRSAANADEISVEILFPRGLVHYADNGTRESVTVTITIDYRRVGDTDWTPIQYAPPVVQNSFTSTIERVIGSNIASVIGSNGGIPISGSTPEVIRHGFRWTMPARDQYDIRITRTTSDSTDSRLVNDSAWTALDSFTNEDPLNFPIPVAKTALVIKASDQLNGAVSQLNGLVQMIAPDWDSSSGTWITRATQSPAAAFRRALQYPGMFQPQPDSAIDLAALQDWSVFCASKGLKFNQYRDYGSRTFDLLADICAAGRATPALKNGKWSVTWDAEQSTPVQYFTPRNSWNFKGTRQFNIIPHAYRCVFANELNGYAVDERVVYRSGFTKDNATIFEQIQPIGITHPDQIYRHAQFTFAQALLRPETWQIDADFEHLICTRGDLVNFIHDVLTVGLGEGRITALTMSGPNIVGVVTDSLFTIESGKSYSIEVRTASNAKIVIALSNSAGQTDTLTFSSPAPSPIAVDDLFGFGISGQVSAEALVTAIQRNPDHGATLTMLPYSRPVYTSDTGTIPPYVPTLTPLQAIGVPEIVTIVSDETVLLRQVDGTLVVRCQVMVKNLALQGAVLAVRVRGHDDFSPYRNMTPDYQTGGSVIFSGITQGDTYEISTRWEVPSRIPGPWSDPVVHTIIGKSTPPPPVDAVRVSLLPTGDTLVEWDYANPPLDWFGVDIYVDGNLIASEITGYSVTLGDAVLKAIGVFRVEVRSLDTTGNEGTGVVFAYTRPRPDPVTSITVERQADGSHLIRWTFDAPLTNGSTFDIYVDGEKILSGMPGLSVSTNVTRLRQVGAHIVGIVVVDIVGLRSNLFEYQYARDLPPDVTSFNMNAVGQNSYFSWDASPAIDIDFYRVKYSPLLTGVTWASSVDFIAKISAPATSASSQGLNGTFLIKAVDRDGNESENAALIETDIDALAASNFVAQIDEAPTFAGSKTNTVVAGSVLTLDSNSTLSSWTTLSSILHLVVGNGGILPTGLYNFANRFDLGAVFTVRLTSILDIEGVDLTDTLDTWPTLQSQATLSGENESAWRAQLQVRTTSDNPASSPVWSDWKNFIVGDYTLRAAEFRLLLFSDLGTVAPEVNTLTVLLDMADRIISDNDVAAPSGGISITYDGAFRVPPAVAIAGQGLATGDYYTFSAKDETGFTIRWFNASNVGVARTFDWMAKGFGKVAP